MCRSKKFSSATEVSWLQILAIAVPLATTTFTIGAAAWQFNATNFRTDQVRFIDAAQATAQETSVLLEEGYIALDKLVGATGDSGWKLFSKGAWHDYMDFRRHWHQQLVAEHFKLSRYFGKDLADQIVHIDEIDLHPVDHLSSPDPCTPAGGKADFDIEKLANQTECISRWIAVEKDVIDDAKTDKEGGNIMGALIQRNNEQEFAHKLLVHYDKAMVRYLRALDERLTQLGQPQVNVINVMSAGRSM